MACGATLSVAGSAFSRTPCDPGREQQEPYQYQHASGGFGNGGHRLRWHRLQTCALVLSLGLENDGPADRSHQLMLRRDLLGLVQTPCFA